MGNEVEYSVKCSDNLEFRTGVWFGGIVFVRVIKLSEQMRFPRGGCRKKMSETEDE